MIGARGIAIAVVAASTFIPSGGFAEVATGVAGTYVAPFEENTMTSSVKWVRNCSPGSISVPEVGTTDAKTGIIGLSRAVAVRRCSSGLSTGGGYSFRVGASPAILVGKPAIVRAVIQRDGTTMGTAEHGSSYREASTSIAMRGAPHVTLTSIDCWSWMGCEKYEIPARANLITVEFALMSLPENIDISFYVGASTGPGTGAAAAWFSGRLLTVTVAPA